MRTFFSKISGKYEIVDLCYFEWEVKKTKKKKNTNSFFDNSKKLKVEKSKKSKNKKKNVKKFYFFNQSNHCKILFDLIGEIEFVKKNTKE